MTLEMLFKIGGVNGSGQVSILLLFFSLMQTRSE